MLSVLAFLMIVSVGNAQKRKKITGNGEITTEERVVSDFSKVAVAGSFDVVLNYGTGGKVTVTADENLMEYIITDIKDNALRIRTKKGYSIRSNKKILVSVNYANLEGVALAGSGDVSANGTVKADALKLSLAGSGDINMDLNGGSVKASIAGSGTMELSGSADKLKCSIAGSGDVNAADLKAGITEASIAGSGNVHVHAVNEVHASIAGSGNVYYTGNPDVEKGKTSGSGKLKKKG
jgi:hypothetical protein